MYKSKYDAGLLAMLMCYAPNIAYVLAMSNALFLDLRRRHFIQQYNTG